jgi:hypothetical protein
MAGNSPPPFSPPQSELGHSNQEGNSSEISSAYNSPNHPQAADGLHNEVIQEPAPYQPDDSYTYVPPTQEQQKAICAWLVNFNAAEKK